MANPVPAYRNSTCDNCQAPIPEGDLLFFDEGNRLCERCAEDDELICTCGSYKKAEFLTCYECHRA